MSATAARSAKVAAIAELLWRAPDGERGIVAGLLANEPRQGRIGVGWGTLGAVEVPPAREPTLTVAEIDGVLTGLAGLGGGGSQAARRALLASILERATADEQALLRSILLGDLKQGALAGVMLDAIARGSETTPSLVRRARMLGGSLAETVAVAFAGGDAGLAAVALRVGRPIEPMLAATAKDVGDALLAVGRASIERKLDGARIQVHRSGAEVAIFTRNANEISARVPELAAVARALPVDRFVLDGEALALAPDGRPLRFQDTMARFGSDADESSPVQLVPFFFDCLHLDGEDLLDAPLAERISRLEQAAPERRVVAIQTDSAGEGEAFLAESLALGHEGVMVKALDSAYAAGRRGSQWRKVKPVRTLDLVVLAAEWGHGRRTGLLSNLHLGARAVDGTFVMVGKTFKGLTDELLAWQTRELLAREQSRSGITVHVRPELVVEIALDGAQASRRYPGGVALRFARVRGYRPDRTPADADTIEAVQALLAGEALTECFAMPDGHRPAAG